MQDNMQDEMQDEMQIVMKTKQKSKVINYGIQALTALFISPIFSFLIMTTLNLFNGSSNYNFLPFIYFLCSIIIAIIAYKKLSLKIFAISFVIINSYLTYLLYSAIKMAA